MAEHTLWLICFLSIVLINLPSSCKAQVSTLLESSDDATANISTPNKVTNKTVTITSPLTKCSRRSILLARQTLNHEFNLANLHNFAWFSDSTKEEIEEDTRNSLSELVRIGEYESTYEPIFEVVSSYFRFTSTLTQTLDQQQTSNARSMHLRSTFRGLHMPELNSSTNSAPIQVYQDSIQNQRQKESIIYNHKQGPSVRLDIRHTDMCHYNSDSKIFTYKFGVSIVPLEHHLDLIFNYPKEIKRTQPNAWTYSTAILSIPKLNFEVTIKQDNGYTLDSPKCPIEIANVAYMQIANRNDIKMQITNVAATNQTKAHLVRLFDDFTRPAVTDRLIELLRFQLSGKTLPLSI